MTTTEITISNPYRTRRWGWAFSTTPIGHGSEIAPPATPEYVGTLNQVNQDIRNDRWYRNARQSGIYMASRYFYDGKPIVAINDGHDWMTIAEALAIYGLLNPSDPFRPETLRLRLVEA